MARPRKDEARDLRTLAIEAAVSMLSRRETPDLSMAEVARHIGCSAPALYAHFADRDDLLDTVRRIVMARQASEKTARYTRPKRADRAQSLSPSDPDWSRESALDSRDGAESEKSGTAKWLRFRALGSGTALETLAAGGHAYLEAAAQAPALYRLIHCRPPTSADAPDAISGPALAALARGVNACRAEGYATDHPPEPLARLLWSLVHGAAMLALDSPKARTAEAWERAHESVDLAIALIAGPRPAPDGAGDDSPSIAHGDGP